VILYRDTNFADEIRTLTGKRGVDVILDHIGADTWEGNVKSLTQGGRLVVCGATSGPEAMTPLRHLFFKNLSILGSTMGSKSELIQVTQLVDRGALRPVVDSVLPLADVAQAHELLESRQTFGKIVLRIT
jgi:NADPH:quinone reductase-like Zn-dependent oxidoreductase